MHHHKYSEDIPYPPLNLVLSAPLWVWEEYGLLRAKLQSPVPNPVVLESTDAAYLTIDAIHRTVQDSCPVCVGKYAAPSAARPPDPLARSDTQF
jgi:hypothetical protein